MKNLLTISLLFFFISCGNGTNFQRLLFEEKGVTSFPSSINVPTDYDRKETFLLNESQKKLPVDILVIVDTSKSMRHHLDKLGKSLSHLLSVIYNYDWQMAFTSTDHGDHNYVVRSTRTVQQKWQDNLNTQKPKFGRLMRLDNGRRVLKETVLNKQMSDYKNIFYHTLSHASDVNCNRPPYCGGILEQPLRSLKSSIERQQLDNDHFFRPEADLVTLIVTNEDERDEDKKRATKAQEVVDTFNEIFSGLNKQFINFSILVKDQDCQNQEMKKGRVATKGEIIKELAILTGGENINICSEDYGLHLEKISRHIKVNLENSLVLSAVPIPRSVHIDFGHFKEIPWSLVGKKIVFKGKIDSTIPISVYYQVSKYR